MAFGKSRLPLQLSYSSNDDPAAPWRRRSKQRSVSSIIGGWPMIALLSVSLDWIQAETPIPRSQQHLHRAPRHLYEPLNTTKIEESPLLMRRYRWLRQSPSLVRLLDETQNDFFCQDISCTVNEQCTKFLFSFLEGTTDAKDNCEGMMNAYVAADCGTMSSSSTAIYNLDDDDGYFGTFYYHQCCSSLRSHYYEYCDSAEILNGYNLLVVAAVMLLCECAKSIVKKNRIRWLPEAAACMLVGMAVALGAGLFGANIDDISFEESIFMYLLLPPIILEAALSVNKRQFRRSWGAIIVFAVFGTLISSFLTGAVTYYSAKFFRNEESLSILDSLVFGSLISSIDPVAILSVLTSLRMSERDTIYVLVSGESLLNDGTAIVLFKALVQQYESISTVSFDSILGSVADFLIIASGSCGIGLACGVACLFYFHLNSSILHPVMEVASFFIWAIIPYWIAEALDWSGIVAIVVMGFFMDIYLRPTQKGRLESSGEAQRSLGLPDEYVLSPGTANNLELEGSRRQLELANKHKTPLEIEGVDFKSYYNMSDEYDADTDTTDSTSTTTSIKAILKNRVQMSREADEHVRFVAHILSSLSENAIFAYLGLFLFNSNYEWDAILCSIGVVSCILSRAIMVVCASWLIIWYMHVFLSKKPNTKTNELPQENVYDSTALDPLNILPTFKSVRSLSNYKVQIVLILAGLRGAVSLALVEVVPIYNGVSGVGSRNKPLLKAMTSSAIIFTIFVLGGGSYYILKWLDISDDDMQTKNSSKKRENGDCPFPPLDYVGYGHHDTTTEMELPTVPSGRDQVSLQQTEGETGGLCQENKALRQQVEDLQREIDALKSKFV